MVYFLKVALILCIPFFQKVTMANPIEVDVLFCTYDISDSASLKRIMAEFDQLNVTYKVLAFGKSVDVFHERPEFIKLDLPDVTWDREKKLGQEHLNLIKKTLKPRMVIAGMASATQAQVLNLFKGDGAYTIAFYDNFDAPENKEYIQEFLKIIGPIDEYFLPSQTTLTGFQKMDATKQAKLSVLGQPALEDWEEIFAKTNRDELSFRLNVDKGDKVILFVGGYDDTYKEYCRLFVKAMKAFENNPHIKIFVTYHPKTDGSLERGIIAEENATNIKVIDKNGPSTAEVATIANVLVCHKSSVGVQALYVGLPVVYVVKKGELNNFAIKQGLAGEVESEQDLVETLKRILTTANRNQAPVKGLGIPKEATENMVARVREVLRQ